MAFRSGNGGQSFSGVPASFFCANLECFLLTARAATGCKQLHMNASYILRLGVALWKTVRPGIDTGIDCSTTLACAPSALGEGSERTGENFLATDWGRQDF